MEEAPATGEFVFPTWQRDRRIAPVFAPVLHTPSPAAESLVRRSRPALVGHGGRFEAPAQPSSARLAAFAVRRTVATLTIQFRIARRARQEGFDPLDFAGHCGPFEHVSVNAHERLHAVSKPACDCGRGNAGPEPNRASGVAEDVWRHAVVELRAREASFGTGANRPIAGSPLSVGAEEQPLASACHRQVLVEREQKPRASEDRHLAPATLGLCLIELPGLDGAPPEVAKKPSQPSHAAAPHLSGALAPDFGLADETAAYLRKKYPKNFA